MMSMMKLVRKQARKMKRNRLVLEYTQKNLSYVDLTGVKLEKTRLVVAESVVAVEKGT